MISFPVSDVEVGRRVDVVLTERAGVTRVLAQRALKSGDVLVGGAQVRPSYRLELGDIVEGALAEPAISRPQAEDIPLDVRYSDDRVMVISKPAGLVVHPAAGHEQGTLVNALLGRGEPLSAATSTRPGIVHRLDKDTSGLLLVARDDEAQEHLVEALRQRQVARVYLALVKGHPAVGSGTVEAPVGRHPTKRRMMGVVSGGRPAVTHYRVLGSSEATSLLEVTLETGRTHQIRVHLTHIGHPIVGDRTYGNTAELATGLGLERPWLHSWRLSFPHPADGRMVAVEDKLPSGLTDALEAAGIAFSPPPQSPRG